MAVVRKVRRIVKYEILEQVVEFVYQREMVKDDGERVKDIKKRTSISSIVTGKLNKI